MAHDRVRQLIRHSIKRDRNACRWADQLAMLVLSSFDGLEFLVVARLGVVVGFILVVIADGERREGAVAALKEGPG